jgi:chromosome segregation ATPase
MIRRMLNIVALILLTVAPVMAWAADNSEFATQPDISTAENDDSVQSTEQARRLTRAWAEHEARRAETARKLDEEQARDREIARLRSAVSGLGRRESFLRHEVYWSQRELDAISRDPADTSAMARRGNVDRELNDLRNQLDLTLTPRQATMRQLDGLRLR